MFNPRNIILLFIWSILLSAPAYGKELQKVLALGVAQMGKPAHYMIVDKFYNEIFSRVGAKVHFVRMPLKRIQYEIERQTIDGDFLSPYGYHKNAVLVDSPIFPLSYSAYAKKDKKESLLCANTLLNGGSCDLAIGYIRGAFVPQEELSTDRFPNILPLNSYESGLRMLVENRIGVFIGSDAIVDSMLEDLAFKDDGICKVVTISQRDGYIYLHEKHQALALRLKSVLDDMKGDGSFERILHDLVFNHGL